jgi:signal transduction histidine kinase
LLVAIVVILVRLVRARKKQSEILERLNQTQQRILSVASHDVKTSVLAQNMVLKMVNEHYENLDHEELKEKLSMLKKGSDELKDKLYNILHWISGEMGKDAVPSEEFNLSGFIGKGISLHSEELKYKKLSVENNIPKSCVCFDKKNVVDIVFQNLFSNAIKFTPQGGTIKVSSIDDGDRVWVEVADTGIGISQERLQQLTHDTVTPSQGTQGERGSGIGLFVSRQLMVKNGGQLIIESAEGQGTTIRFNVKKAKV